MPPPAVSVRAQRPPGWEPTSIAQPSLGGGSDASLTQWTALRSPLTGDVLLLGCVATPIPGWIEDMRPSIEGRMLAFAGSSSERLVGVDIDSRLEAGHLDLFVARSEGRGPADRIGMTRVFLGFSAGKDVATCFVTCATPRESAHAGPPACEASVLGAGLDGTVEAPPPGALLAATTWAIHHPHPTALWGSILVIFAGASAVVFRRRPRSRI